MTEFKNYCMGCMKEIDEDITICPHCSYNALSSQTAPFLSKGSVVSGKYLVGKVESFSTDSITYIGLDLETETTVNIIFNDVEFDGEWEDADKNCIFAMQEDANYLIDNLPLN